MKSFMKAFGGSLAGGLVIWLVLVVKDAVTDDPPPPPPCVQVTPDPVLTDD